MENQNYKASPTTPLAVEEVDFQRGAIDEMDEEAAAKEHLTSSDPTKVKFISANSEYTRKNGDAKVDIENVQRSVGMGKDELMKYANDPFWVRLRMGLFILFWVVWIAMLVGSVVIIFLAPRCPPAPQLDWWEKTVVYQVLVGSYKDSNGDGRGDINGLIEKLDYLKDKDVNTLLLSPIYPTSTNDYEYDVIDFKNIHERYGKMEDFENLVQKANEKDMKIIMEFIPNHSSTQHPWFTKSAQQFEPYKDFYIWNEGIPSSSGERKDPPNNWKSVHGGPAWVYDEVRKQYYLSQFFPEQADLNLRNPQLKKELEDILQFWLDKGVDGFKINNVQFLYESASLENEPVASVGGKQTEREYDQLNHLHTLNLQENLDQLKEWREFLDNYVNLNTTEEKHRRIILTDVINTDVNETAKYYGNSTNRISDVPFYFGITELPLGSEANHLSESINSWLEAVPEGLWPNWVLGSLSSFTRETKAQRLASKVGKNFLDALHAVAILIKGTPIVYYGDEIGMEDVHIDDSEVVDAIATRTNTETTDVVKTPMQWDNSTMAGFTEGPHSFLPISKTAKEINVESESAVPNSHLNIFKRLVGLRKEPAIQFGNTTVKALPGNIFAMTRIRKGNPAYLVLVNFGVNGTTVDVIQGLQQIPDNGRVEIVSYPTSEVPLNDKQHPKVTLSNVNLASKQMTVISFVPKKLD